MKKKIHRGITYILCIGIFVIMVEIFLALIPPFRYLSFHNRLENCHWILEEHSSLIHDFSKEKFIFDKKNMGEIKRGSRKFRVARDNNTLRIVCIGSSSTVGLEPLEEEGEEFHYPLHLETLFKADGKNVEVINGGLGGIGFYPLLVYFKEVLLHLEPNLVIIYFGGNGDGEEYIDYYQRAEEVRRIFPHITTNSDLVAAMDLKTHSRILLNIYIILIKHSRLFFNFKRLADYIKFTLKPKVYADCVDIGSRNIDEFINICISRNISVILIPEICINKSSMNTFEFNGLPYNDIFYNMAQKYCDSHVYYLRLHEKLAHEITNPSCFFEDGQHMTQQGYTWLASSIYEFINNTMEINGSKLIYKH